MTKQQLLNLMYQDLDAAFDVMDKVFLTLNKNSNYVDLCREYIDPPNNFSITRYRSRLKRFIILEYEPLNTMLVSPNLIDFELMNLQGTLSDYYAIVKTDDNSITSARRTQVKILVKEALASTKKGMKILIPKVNEIIKHHTYHKSSDWKAHFKNSPCDVVWLHFYNSTSQVKTGLPFCTTQWIRHDLTDKPMAINAAEKIGEIAVEWNDAALIDPFDRMTKGEFMEYANPIFEIAQNLFHAINDLFKNNSSNYQIEISTYSKQLQELHFKYQKKKLPPIECHDLNLKLNCLVNSLDDIRLVVDEKSRAKHNVLFLIKDALKRAETHIRDYIYEKNKIS